MSESKETAARKGLENEKHNRRHMHARRKNKRDTWESKDRGKKGMYAREYNEMEEDNAGID